MNKCLVSLVTLVIGTSGCSENHSDGKQTAEARSMESTLDRSVLWHKVRLGSWECAVPEKNPDATLVCTKGQRVVVVASDDSAGFIVSIPLSKKNQAAILTLTDKDKDGINDRLNYDGTSKEGTILRSVVDEDLDGNIDQVFDFNKKKVSVYIDGAWIELESAGHDDKGLAIHKANINGSMKRVLFNSYPYQVIDLPTQANSTTQPKQ